MATPQNSPGADPLYECDLVLKGGVTSGLVYPSAVVKIAETHRFRSIGGSSAGAMAAALTAAAELGRDTGGFDRLKDVPAECAATDEQGRTRLLDLFQPQPTTHGLFALARRVQEAKGRHRPRVLLAQLARTGVRSGWFVLGVVVALFLADLSVGAVRRSSGATVTVLVCCLGLLALAALGVVAVFAGTRALVSAAPAAVAGNLHGLCTGLGAPGRPGVCDWLHEHLQTISGRGTSADPVTYGMLQEAGLRLVTTTTNVSQGRAVNFPPTDGPWAYRPSDLARLLPADVVRHLEAAPSPAGPTAAQRERAAAAGLRLLPDVRHLPILLGARISLSFPVLLSGVPLWTWATTSTDPQAAPTWVECWFSDGGITSNLPVHLFDNPLPRRPTYAINLSGGGSPDGPVDRAVRRPRNPAVDDRVPVRPVAGTGEFLHAIYDTMQNWVDNSQARVPGVRERICTVQLADGEGGLNLAMGDAQIARLVELGTAAGGDLAVLRTAAGRDRHHVVENEWNEHRFLRLRCFLAGSGGYLEDAAPAWFDLPDDSPSYPLLARGAAAGGWFPVWGAWTPGRADRAENLLSTVLAKDLTPWTADPPPVSRLVRRSLHDDAGPVGATHHADAGEVRNDPHR